MLRSRLRREQPAVQAGVHEILFQTAQVPLTYLVPILFPWTFLRATAPAEPGQKSEIAKLFAIVLKHLLRLIMHLQLESMYCLLQVVYLSDTLSRFLSLTRTIRCYSKSGSGDDSSSPPSTDCFPFLWRFAIFASLGRCTSFRLGEAAEALPLPRWSHDFLRSPPYLCCTFLCTSLSRYSNPCKGLN